MVKVWVLSNKQKASNASVRQRTIKMGKMRSGRKRGSSICDLCGR